MVIDCIPFFNELDLLEVRLNELADVVDMFVITESPYTFTGIEKPLYFSDNFERFMQSGRFNIAHNAYLPDRKLSPGAYEKAQKDHNLQTAFRFARPGDTLIVGDVDEIPRASVIRQALNDKDWMSAGLVMDLFYYFLNCKCTIEKKRRDSRLIRVTRPFEYNSKQNDKVDKLYYRAGWHFSFLGDIEYKLKSYNHADLYDKPPYNDPEHIEKCRSQGLDLFERKGKRKLGFEFLDDLSFLPQYVLDNKDKFNKYIKA